MRSAVLILSLLAAACSPEGSGEEDRFEDNAEHLLGDLDGVRAWMDSAGTIRPTLQSDLDRLATAGIPVDIVFEQGPEVLGLPVIP